ncbi:MAG: rRNA adenine dimethyltransferase family protein, partial [Patescibacteria group bacterium]
TEKLASRVKKVIAVELDDKLIKILQDRLKKQGIRNVEVINGDILKISNFKFQISNQIPNPKFKYRTFGNKYKIVANLPYNITSIFLRKFLGENEAKPELMVLMLQKEVAQRIVAKDGKMSILAVSVQFYAKPEIIDYVSKENFWPEPEVDSAIVRLNVGAIHELPVQREKEFFQLVRIGFSSKRKMLKNNLAAGYQILPVEAEKKLIKAGFNTNIRAQELSVESWLRLLTYFK